MQFALATVEDYRLHDYAMSLLTFAAAARLALHRGDRKEVDRQLARAMRARPSCTFALPYVAVRARLQLAKVYAASLIRQRHVTCCGRSTTSCSAGRPWECWSRRSRNSAQILKDNAQVTVAGGRP